MPQRYFIRFTKARSRRLTEARIQSGSLYIQDYSNGYPVRGLVLQEADLARALEVLGSDVAYEEETDHEDVTELRLHHADADKPGLQRLLQKIEERSRPHVRVENWGYCGCNRDQFVDVVREFLPVFGVSEIVIIDRMGEEEVCDQPRQKEGQFTIFTWSRQSGHVVRGQSKKVLWDIEIASSDNHWNIQPLSGDGILVEDDRGTTVAEIVGDNLYVLYPVTSRDFPAGVEVFRKILEAVSILRTETDEQKQERLRVIVEQRKIRSRTEYMRVCSKRIEKAVAEATQAIHMNETKAREYERGIVECVRRTREAKLQLERIEIDKTKSTEKFGTEFDKLFAIPNVRDVRVEEDVIKVFTDKLYAVHPTTKVKYEIGAFRIEIYLNGEVRWFNLTRQVNVRSERMQAPHVYEDGHACLGNASVIFPDLIANYEFAACVMVAMNFVESVNINDIGTDVKFWPVAA